jgi:hypothetical protein
MIYIKGNQIYYITKPIANELLADLYNFSTMTHVPQAYRPLALRIFQQQYVHAALPEPHDRYTLELNFLGNKLVPYIDELINEAIEYFSAKQYAVTRADNPLALTINDIQLQQAVDLIDDNEFQTINTIIATAHCSTWKLQVL